MSAGKAVVQLISRGISRSAVKNSSATEVPSGYFKSMKAQQQRFQVDTNEPIYIKGGFGDKMLYGVTLILTAIGLGMTTEVLYKLSCPSKD